MKVFTGPLLDDDYDLLWTAAEQRAVRQSYGH